MTSTIATPPLDLDTVAANYARDGFTLIPDALSAAEVEALRVEATRICREHFESSGATEELDDAALLRRYLCLHYPHKASDLALQAMKAEPVIEVLTRAIGPNVKSMQSMLFIKSEGKPGQAWHQDEHFIPTRDRSLTGVWIALDDATVENGCLWVLPGSHQRGVLYPDALQDDPRFDCTNEAYGFPYDEKDAIPLEVPAGTALVFNGYLLHRSLENSGKHGYRRALVNHYMSAESLLPWRLHGEQSVGEADFRDIVLVAGEDPYAYKGIDDRSRPHSRAEKDGGCDR